MWVIVIAALIVAAPFIVGKFLPFLIMRTRHESEAWDLFHRATEQLLDDRDLNQKVQKFVDVVASHAGSGRLTLFFIIATLKPAKPTPENNILSGLTQIQADALRLFMVLALNYDSYRVPVFGGLLRALALYWLRTLAGINGPKVTKEQAAPITRAAEKAYQFKLA